MASRALVQFQEVRYPVLFEDFRIFVQGVEITSWVTGSLTVAKANRDGIGSASFTLDNAMDRFILTDKNLEGVWRDTNDKYSEAAKHQIYSYKRGDAIVTLDRIKDQFDVLYNRELDLAMLKSRKQMIADLGRRDVQSGDDTSTLAMKLAVRKAMRQMPAASLKPWDSSYVKLQQAAVESMQKTGAGESEAEGLMFDAIEDETNRVIRSEKARDKEAAQQAAKNEKRGIREVENGDPELKGRYSRQANIRNPVDSDTGDSRWPLSERSVIFHKNDPIRIFLHNPFSEKDQWIYGFTGFIDEYPVTTDYVTSESNIQIQCYDIRALMQKMRIQQNALIGLIQPSGMFENRSSVFADLVVPSHWGQSFANMKFEEAIALLTTGTTLERKGQSKVFGVGDFVVGKVVTYPKTKNVHDAENKAILESWHSLCLNGPSMISDKKSIANTVFLTSDQVEKIGRGTTFDGEYSPLLGYVHFLLPGEGTGARTLTSISFDAGSEQRDWVTRYDIVTEFCGRLDYEFYVAPNGDMIFEFPMYDFLPEDFGDWQPMFEADYHLIDGSMSDESGDIITALIVTGQPANATINPNLPAAFTIGVVQSSLMATRVGITTEQMQLPFCTDPTRLRSLGFVEFQKRLSLANSFDMSWGFRPYITPNRPLLNKVEKRMGLTTNVTETMQLFQTCTTAPTVKYVRQIRSDGKFRFITGGDSMPISYRTIYPGKQKSFGNATVGVRTNLEVDGSPSAVEKQKVEKHEGNEGQPPSFVREMRPGTYFSLDPKTRKVVDVIAQTLSDRNILLTNIPKANGTSFSIRARDPEGKRLYTDQERSTLASQAKEQGYILVDTQQRFIFQVRRAGQPDFIVRSENAG